MIALGSYFRSVSSGRRGLPGERGAPGTNVQGPQGTKGFAGIKFLLIAKCFFVQKGVGAPKLLHTTLKYCKFECVYFKTNLFIVFI